MALAVTKYKKYFIKRLISTPSDSRFKNLHVTDIHNDFTAGVASLLAFKLCAIFDRAISSRMYGS